MQYTVAAARAAEMRKHEKNDAKCTELGWMCVPLAVDSYGAWGVKACNAFSFFWQGVKPS